MLPAATVDPADLQSACGDHPQVVCRWVLEQTGNEVLARLADWFLGKPLRIALTLALALAIRWLAVRLVRRGITRLANLAGRTGLAPQRTAQRAETVSFLLRSSVSVAIWFVAVLAVLGVLGVESSSLAVLAAAVGAGLGFGAQTLVRDLLGGLLLALEDQCGVGDTVEVAGVVGTVEELTLRTVRVRDASGALWHVAAGDVRALGNRSQGFGVAVIDVAVAPEEDVDRAGDVAVAAARSMRDDEAWADVVLDEPTCLGIEDETADRVVVRLTVRTTAGQAVAVRREARRRIRTAFAREAIAVPRPAVPPPVGPVGPVGPPGPVG